MNTFNRMKEKFEKVFTREQAEVLSTWNTIKLVCNSH
jgi:hypothetical protein